MSPDQEPEPPRLPDAFRQLLEVENRSFGLPLVEPVLSRLAIYLAELDRWRRRVNLTGRLTPEELANHALESTLGSKLIPHMARVVDIGSGGGFPGLPLAIARPDLAVALVEPRSRRAAFLRHVGRTLALGNVEVLESRIEEVAGRTFDVATTRAVGRFSEWIGRAPFLSPSGSVLAWTTDIEVPGPCFRLEGSLPVPGSDKRRIVSFRRVA